MQGKEREREEREKKTEAEEDSKKKSDHSKLLFSEKETGRSFIYRNERKGINVVWDIHTGRIWNACKN